MVRAVPVRTIAAPSIVVAITAAIDRGLAGEPLWRLAGLDPAGPHGVDRRVPEARMYAVYAAIMHALRDPGFPCDVARRVSIDSFDALGLACKTAPTLMDALARLRRYQRFWTDTSRYELHVDGTRTHVEFVRDGERSLGLRVANEAALGELLQSLRGALGPSFAPIEASFRHGAPAVLHAHRKHFACPLRFDAPRDALTLDTAVLARPNPGAHATLAQFLAEHLEHRLGDRPDGDVVEAIRHQVLSSLGSSPPRMSTVARRMGTSERSLTRRLAERGTTFSALLDAARRRLAEELLAEGRHTASEIGYLLGFNDASAFHRAFVRWTGRRPGELARKRPA